MILEPSIAGCLPAARQSTGPCRPRQPRRRRKSGVGTRGPCHKPAPPQRTGRPKVGDSEPITPALGVERPSARSRRLRGLPAIAPVFDFPHLRYGLSDLTSEFHETRISCSLGFFDDLIQLHADRLLPFRRGLVFAGGQKLLSPRLCRGQHRQRANGKYENEDRPTGFSHAHPPFPHDHPLRTRGGLAHADAPPLPPSLARASRVPPALDTVKEMLGSNAWNQAGHRGSHR